MHRDHKIFIQAIKTRKKILIKHQIENNRNACTKVYCPLFYIPSGEKGSSGCYYLRQDETGSRGSIVSIKAERIIRIGQTQESFDPIGLTLLSGDDPPPEHK